MDSQDQALERHSAFFSFESWEKFKPLARAFCLTYSTFILTLFISVLTNKWIALKLGTNGVALAGIFRTFGAVVTGILGLGYATLLNQTFANARDPQAKKNETTFLLYLSLMQFVVLFFAVVFFSDEIASLLLFGGASSLTQLTVYFLLFMAFANTLYQNLLASLRGLMLLKELSLIHIAVSVVSLLLIPVLVQLGDLGLALNLGSGTLAGSFFALFYLFKNVGKISFANGDFGKTVKTVIKNFRSSFFLIWQVGYWMMVLLVVQNWIGHSFGMETLGNFNASYLVVDTTFLLLVSSIRSYCLPLLAKASDSSEKKEIVHRVLLGHLVMGFLAVMALMIGARWIIPLLFSQSFVLSIRYLTEMCLGLIPMMIIMVYNTVLLDRQEHASFVTLDTIWVGVFLLIGYLTTRHFSPYWLPLVYVGSAFFGNVLYLSFIRIKLGKGWINPKVVLASWIGMIILYGGQQFIKQL